MNLTYRRRLLQALPFVGFDLLLLGLALWNSFFVYTFFAHDMSDFGTFYASAVAYLAGQNMYDLPTGTLAQLTGRAGQEFRNLNPPHFHIFILPLALLPRGMALGVWSLASVLAFAASLRVIIHELGVKFTPWRRRWSLFGLLSFPGTAAMLETGQLSFLLLLPLTLAWVDARRGHWTWAGAYLGFAMSIKIFLLIFVPYLVFQRQFRALLVAGLVGMTCFLCGVLVFGLDTHWAWLHSLTAVADWAWLPLNVSVFGFLSKAFLPNLFFPFWPLDPFVVRLLWLVIIAAISAFTLVCVAPSVTKPSIDRDFSMLLLASQLISPLGWLYYLWFAIGPLLACARVWWQENTRKAGAYDSPAQRWRNYLVYAAILGLVWPWPLSVVLPLQPSFRTTVTIGSVYFWATLFLWAALVADCAARKGRNPIPVPTV